MDLVTKPLTKEDFLKVFAPGYLPMEEDLDQAALDALDLGLMEAPEEITKGTREQKMEYLDSIPLQDKQHTVDQIPKSIEMCRICKRNAEHNNKHWPPCDNPMLNKQFQFDLLDAAGAFDDLSPDEKLERLYEANPVVWAESEFLLSDKTGKKRAWTPRWYQEMFMLCSNLDRAALWGRRLGKSENVIILCLHAAVYRPGQNSADREYGIHVFTHSETLQEKHYREFMRFIESAKTQKYELAARGSKKDKLILYKNGSTINFHVISGKQRGVSGKMIWFDEAAFYENEGAIAAAMGLRLEGDGNVTVIMTSNSSGFRGRFYRYCHKADTFLTQLSAHYNPDWDIKMELTARSEFTDEEYELEVEAKWGEAKSAVFSPRYIDAVKEMFPYSYDTRQGPYQISVTKPQGVFRVLGCDWNEGMNGVHFVVVEHNPNIISRGESVIRVVHKSIITGDEWSHQAAKHEAFELMVGWDCDAAFLDWGGGGSMAVPDLKVYLGASGYGHLVDNIIPIDMQKAIEVPDPFQPDMTYKVPQKNVMVKQTQRLLQQLRLAYPEEEYQDANPKMRERNIVPQMREYRVERVTARGQAVYSTNMEEHTLTAYMLAVYGCVVSCTEMLVKQDKPIGVMHQNSKNVLPSEQKNLKQTPKDDLITPVIARNRNMPRYIGRGLGSRTHGLRSRRDRDD